MAIESAQLNNTSRKRETCALLGFLPLQVNEQFSTTAEVIATHREIPALLKPMKLLGDYDVSAGDAGTPEVTATYMNMTPGQVYSRLNTIIENSLSQEQPMNNLAPNSEHADDMQKLKSFNEFPVTTADTDNMITRITTPAIVNLDFAGTTVHAALVGTNATPAKAATTVEMNGHKEHAMKRMAEFISSYHGNNQQTTYTKEVS